MSASSTSAFKPEPTFEKRIYSPKVYPGTRANAWVNKVVHVRWMPPVFSLFGGGGKSGPLHELTNWFGYVTEIDGQVPGSELLPLPKETPK